MYIHVKLLEEVQSIPVSSCDYLLSTEVELIDKILI